MKPLLLIIVCIATLALCGCERKDGSSTSNDTNSSTTTPATAPADYLGALHKGQVAAEKTTDLAGVRSAIQMFQVEHDRYPKDLNELVTEGTLPRLPATPRGMEFKYDAASGKVSLVPVTK